MHSNHGKTKTWWRGGWLLGMAVWVASVQSDGVADAKKAFFIPMNSGFTAEMTEFAWVTTTTRVMLKDYRPPEPIAREKLLETMGVIAEAVRTGDDVTFSEQCTEDSRTEIERLAHGKSVLDYILWQNFIVEREIKAWRIYEVFDLSRNVAVILELSGNVNGHAAARICLPMIKDAEGNWRMDFTRYTHAARSILGALFGVRKEDEAFATELADEPVEAGATVLISWPFGGKQDGWLPVEIVAKGEVLWGRNSTNPVGSLYLRQRKIISRIAEGGVTAELAAAFLDTLVPSIRPEYVREVRTDPEGFREICQGEDLGWEPIYVIDGGEGHFLLLSPTENLGVAEASFDTRMWLYQALDVNGTFKNADFGFFRQLSKLFTSIDLARIVFQEGESSSLKKTNSVGADLAVGEMTSGKD